MSVFFNYKRYEFINIFKLNILKFFASTYYHIYIQVAQCNHYQVTNVNILLRRSILIGAESDWYFSHNLILVYSNLYFFYNRLACIINKVYKQKIYLSHGKKNKNNHKSIDTLAQRKAPALFFPSRVPHPQTSHRVSSQVLYKNAVLNADNNY